MKVFKHWAKAEAPVRLPNKRQFNVRSFGGSNVSVEEALEKARERAKSAAASLQRGIGPRQHYDYGERPLREEIVESLTHADELVAVLTRNSYGSVVLNSVRVLFADIDYQPASPIASIGKSLARLFGRKKPAAEDNEIVTRVGQVAAEWSGLRIRLYRTANGFRCAVASRLFDPAGDDSRQLMVALGTDPLYIKLCRSQECFRARLTPKHWRCGLPRPPVRFPYADAVAEQRFRQWDAKYLQAIAGYSTCAPIGEYGDGAEDAAAARVLQVHDQLACHDDAPLA